MIEIKLSQGAKPGHGGVLPGAKVTAEIAAIRGVEPGKDCVSPAAHSAFSTPARARRLHRQTARALGRQAGRLQALRRPPVGIPRRLQGDGRDRDHSRLHRGRRHGGRDRRGAARIRRPSRPADARGPRLRAQRADRDQRARAHPHRLLGQDRQRLRHGARHRARGGLVQRGARLHVRARLHPVDELPHRRLPDRRRHPGPDALARARRRGQDASGCGATTPRCCMRSPSSPPPPGSTIHGTFGRSISRGGSARPSR